MNRSFVRFLLLGSLWVHALVCGADEPSMEDFLETQRKVQSALPRALDSTIGVGSGGTGVIVSEDGLVLTAAHVSGEPGRPISCVMPDGKRVRARTLGRFDHADAGMVQLDGEGPWPFSPLGSRKSVDAGDWCFALGHPGGFDKDRGPVLRVGKVIYARSDTIRTDCELLRGDSGGPLFNVNGEVIGINSRIGDPLDDNYHAPVDAFHKMWDFLLAGEDLPNTRDRSDRGDLGVDVKTHDKGVVVTRVRENTVAVDAGILVDDVILSVDGYSIDDSADYRWAIGKNVAGATVKIEYLRGESTNELSVELGKAPRRARWRGRGF